MNTIVQDLRYSVRTLLKHKSFTVIAVLTLALGIGANTAMFSVLNTYLFRALPYPNSEQLVRIFRTSPHSQSWPHSAPSLLAQRDQNTVFQQLATYNGISPNLAEEGEAAERLSGYAVTHDFFSTLSVQPALGRAFTAEEDQSGAHQVVVLSDRFWQRRFGGDPGIVGRTLRLDGENVKVIGVMPMGFDHPLLWGTVDVWRPLALTPEQRQNWGNNYLRAFARLKPGVSLQQAQAEMTTLGANLVRDRPLNRGESLRLEPLSNSTSDDTGRKVMWFTFGLAGFVLLIACANLANLQLVRTATRAREFAVRTALGAGRWRLIRQCLTESLVLSLRGAFAALGLVLAAIGIYGVISYTVAQRTGEIGIRLALGAAPRNILWMVLGRGSRLILAGALLGLGGAYAVGQLLLTALPMLPTRDPLALSAITALLILVALLACWIPARRATKVDPMVALRWE